MYLIDVFVLGINLSIKVLQAGAWPLGPTQVVIPFAVPQEFEKAIRMVGSQLLLQFGLNLKIYFFNSSKPSITIHLVAVNLPGCIICATVN